MILYNHIDVSLLLNSLILTWPVKGYLNTIFVCILFNNMITEHLTHQSKASPVLSPAACLPPPCVFSSSSLSSATLSEPFRHNTIGLSLSQWSRHTRKVCWSYQRFEFSAPVFLLCTLMHRGFVRQRGRQAALSNNKQIRGVERKRGAAFWRSPRVFFFS